MRKSAMSLFAQRRFAMSAITTTSSSSSSAPKTSSALSKDILNNKRRRNLTTTTTITTERFLAERRNRSSNLATFASSSSSSSSSPARDGGFLSDKIVRATANVKKKSSTTSQNKKKNNNNDDDNRAKTSSPRTRTSGVDVVSSKSSPSVPTMKHETMDKWVVFSDLHVSRKTKDVCLQTLKYVHDVAARENRGVLFLGDFWHHRGALPVDTLNEIMFELSKWTQPTIMLVGNHDQVNVQGSIHALEVLRMCNPETIVVFDEPRVWRGALWLPYRKDQETLRRSVEDLMTTEEIKRTKLAARDGESNDAEEGLAIKTVFCHADVMGANVNQTFQMKNGVDSKETFSKEKTGIESIISGHYHKPHFVERDSRVRYVGSPYQISRAEKNQEKYLLFLNDKWRDESLFDEEILKRSKIDIGPRYFDIDETIGESIETIAGDLRANDIVRWTIPFDSALDMEEDKEEEEEDIVVESVKKKSAKKKKSSLSRSVPKRVENARLKYGCQIEVRRPPAELKSTIENAESLSPVDLFNSYAKSIRLSGDAKAFCEEIITEAVSSKENEEGKLDTGDDSNKLSTSAHLRKVEFDEVEISGFGAFKDEITYPLNDRGVVCVVGDNRDDSGFADSNGAGKTTLVTAVMWALTGKSDVRLDTGSTQKYLTNKDVVNDDSKSARVVVRGSLIDQESNRKKPFVIERAVTRTKLSKLSFIVDDMDETKLDAKKTQEHMDEIIGASVVAQTCFHGQHTIGSLLEASDAQLKNSFGSLVEQSVWTRCKNRSKKLLKERREKLTIARAELKSRESYVERTKLRFLETEKDFNRWKETFEEKVRTLTMEREDALDALALDRMRNARQAVNEVKDIERIANEALRRILDFNDTAASNNEFRAEEDIATQNKRANENDQRHKQLDRDEQSLLKLFNDAQRNEASSRATAEQAHKSAGQVFNLSKQSAAHHQHSIDKETLKCTLCHQSIDPIKQRETFEQLKRDAEVMRLKHVQAIETLNDCRVKLDQFQRFKKSELERMLNEERALQNLKFARVERENKKMMLTNELKRLSSLLVNVSERFAQMLPYVPEEVLALEENARSFSDDDDAFRLEERRKRREEELYAITSGSFSSEREALSGIVPGLLDYRTPYTSSSSSSSRGYASSKSEDGGNGFIQNNVVAAKNNDGEHASLAQLLDIDQSTGLLADESSLPFFAKAVQSKVASAETLIAGCEKALRDYERINQKYLQDVNNSDANFNNNNPHFEAMKQLQEQLNVETESLNDLKENSYSKIEFDLNVAKIADKCFSPTRGVSNYLFENVLAEVSERCQEYVFALTGGALSLQLVSSNSSASASPSSNISATFDDDDNDDDSIDEIETKTHLEKIERIIFARKQHSGEQYERSLRQLSGGERRRLAIGLALAYADVSARRLNVQSNLLILDEALQHLDSEGIERVVSVLRAIESEYSSNGNDDDIVKKTVLLTTQADSETEKMFDGVDAVVKNKNRSEVLIGRGE